MVAVLLILLSSGTFCFYHQHSILSCFSLFFYGAYLFVKRKTSLSSVIKNKSFLFVVTYTFWIWINFLVFNTNHVATITQPYVYCLILWGTFFIILENFCYCLIQKTLGELPDFEVMTWQLCNLLRSTLNCLQGTLILLQRYEFYLYIKSTVLFIMSLR